MITDKPDVTENKTLHILTDVFFSFWVGTPICFYLGVIKLCANCLTVRILFTLCCMLEVRQILQLLVVTEHQLSHESHVV